MRIIGNGDPVEVLKVLEYWTSAPYNCTWLARQWASCLETSSDCRADVWREIFILMNEEVSC